MVKKNSKKDTMGIWCFAIVNGRLAEIFYDDRKRVCGHCYVNRKDYKTKQEQKWIEQDTKKLRFVWRNKQYRQKSPKDGDWVEVDAEKGVVRRLV